MQSSIISATIDTSELEENSQESSAKDPDVSANTPIEQLAEPGLDPPTASALESKARLLILPGLEPLNISEVQTIQLQKGTATFTNFGGLEVLSKYIPWLQTAPRPVINVTFDASNKHLSGRNISSPTSTTQWTLPPLWPWPDEQASATLGLMMLTTLIAISLAMCSALVYWCCACRIGSNEPPAAVEVNVPTSQDQRPVELVSIVSGDPLRRFSKLESRICSATNLPPVPEYKRRHTC